MTNHVHNLCVHSGPPTFTFIAQPKAKKKRVLVCWT